MSALQQKTNYTACDKNTLFIRDCASIIIVSINEEFHGRIAWMCNLATQTTLMSRNRDCRAESGSGNPSHEPSYMNHE